MSYTEILKKLIDFMLFADENQKDEAYNITWNDFYKKHPTLIRIDAPKAESIESIKRMQEQIETDKYRRVQYERMSRWKEQKKDKEDSLNYATTLTSNSIFALPKNETTSSAQNTPSLNTLNSGPPKLILQNE